MTDGLRIFVSAGERSGDLHASGLVREVLRRDGAVTFEGFGGDLLAGAGCTIHQDTVSIASMGVGFWRHLGRYYRTLRCFQRILKDRRPHLVVLVDSPGLNFALARLARWQGLPVAYYICPQIWAWAPWRKAKVLRYTDLLLVILPFEEDVYRNRRVPVHYVGHPLADSLAECPADAGLALRRELGIPEGHRVVSLLPGSRQREVRQLMPLLGQVLSSLDADRSTTHVLVSCLRPEFREPIEAELRSCPFPARILDVDARSIIMAGDIVLVASGTASLEVVYFEKPMVVLYRVGAVARFFFQLLSVTPFFTLPNILGGRLFGGRPVVMERLCKGGEAPEIARAAGALLAPGPVREEAISRLREVKASAFRPGATARAADLLLDFISRLRLEPPGDS